MQDRISGERFQDQWSSGSKIIGDSIKRALCLGVLTRYHTNMDTNHKRWLK